MRRIQLANLQRVIPVIGRRRLLAWLGACALGGVVIGSGLYYAHWQYQLSSAALILSGRPYVAGQAIQQTEQAFSYNAAQAAGMGAKQHQIVMAANKANSTGQQPYSARLPVSLQEGLTFGNATGDLSFKLRPLFATAPGKLVSDRVVYPMAGAKQVYSFMRNGVKEDILLEKAPGDTAKYQWQLDMGRELEARLMTDGSVGVYSADPNLFGNVSVGDDKSQKLLDNARRNGQKTHLAFVIPAPVIVTADGRKFNRDVAFTLAGNRLTLTARNLHSYQYPLSIDPSVVVTTTADFATGGDQGMIDYATANQITRATISGGALAANFASAGSSFTGGRLGHATAIYNGYIYVIGGHDGSTYQNDVQYAQITGAGTTGSWASAGTGFTNGRYFLAAFAYNGRLYITGGKNGAGTKYNDVQYVSLASNGTLTGSWTTKSSGLYSNARWGLAAAEANGFFYISGGYNDTTYYQDVQYAPIQPDGSVGTFGSAGNTIPSQRYLHSMVIYNDTMYIIAGASSTVGVYLTDVSYAHILSNGTIGAFTTVQNITTARYGQTAYAYRGYLYVVGGQQQSSSTACKPAGNSASSFCSDVQYAPIKSYGSLDSFVTDTKFIGAAGSGMDRVHPTGVAYNGYLYIIGGYNGFSDVRSAQINATTGTHGGNSTWSSSANTFTTGRMAHGVTAYNGYLYVTGGLNISSGTYATSTYYAQIQDNGDIGSWTSTTSIASFGARVGFGLKAYNGYLYLVGGENSSGTQVADTHYIQINSNGSLAGSWSTGSSLNTARWAFGMAVYNGYIYVSGGEQSSSTLNSIEYVQLNSNGTMGASWTTAGTTMPTARRFTTAAAHNGTLYTIGGSNSGGTKQDVVEYVALNTNGSLGGSWTTSNMPAARDSMGAIAFNGYLYVVSGVNSSGTTVGSVYVSKIGSSGTLGSWTTNSGSLNTARYALENAVTASNGRIYVVGGNDGGGGTNTTEYAHAVVQTQDAQYERVLDLGVSSNTNLQVDSLVANGTAVCGLQLAYRTAATGGTWGALTTLPFVGAGQTATITTTNVQYVWVKYTLTDSLCGTASNITDITLNWSYNSAPPAPTLSTPSNGATGIAALPTFQMRSTQLNSGYLRYKIDVCSTSNCSSIVRTIDQTSSQTGWTGQDVQTSTAYAGSTTITSSTMASHTYQTAGLSSGTQYWWRAYAIDPGNSNTFGSASGIWSFTTVNTNATPPAPTLSAPANSATGVSTAPIFQMASTDADGDYVRYKIDVCSTSNCSSIVRTIDQTSSQTGWTGQDTQSGTAYASGSTASHGYQAPVLSNSTQYWWRAYAIDPAGTNTFSSASSIFSFTTASGVPPTVNSDLRGGTTVFGGTKLAN